MQWHVLSPPPVLPLAKTSWDRTLKVSREQLWCGESGFDGAEGRITPQPLCLDLTNGDDEGQGGGRPESTRLPFPSLFSPGN